MGLGVSYERGIPVTLKQIPPEHGSHSEVTQECREVGIGARVQSLRVGVWGLGFWV